MNNSENTTDQVNPTDHVRQLIDSGSFQELLDTYGMNRLPRIYNDSPKEKKQQIIKADLTTTDVIELLKNGKTNNRKFGGQFPWQTPDTTQKNTTEERDVDSWGVERQRKKENREWGLPEEHDMSDPAPADPNVAKPSRSNNLVDPMKIAAEEEPLRESDKKLRQQVTESHTAFEAKLKTGEKPKKQMTYAELVAHRKANPEEYPEIALEHLEKEGTGGHGVGDAAGAQVVNGGSGFVGGAHVSTSAGIFTGTHGGHRGRKIKRTNDGSHTVGEENFTTRGNYVPALTEYVKKQFLDKAKAPYYNRDVQALDTSTIRDQKSQKKQSKQDNMAGHKRNSIWRNP
jgi:hypothetical protein